MRHLHVILRNVSQPRIVEMRAAMADVWPRLLWTTTSPQRRDEPSPRSYLGETGESDAFATFVSVLSRRLDGSAGV